MSTTSYIEDHYTPEQQDTVKHIIDLEKKALDKYFKGDMSGYLDLWSKDNLTYFDAGTKERIDKYADVEHFLKTVVEGKMHADSYDFHFPRVQLTADTAILTYQLHADTSLIEMHYNVIEVFQNVNNKWTVIHSTWDLITPFSTEIKRPQKIV